MDPLHGPSPYVPRSGLGTLRALRALEDHFDELTIEHTQRSNNRHAHALATLGSKIIFEGESTKVTILKRSIPITLLLQEEFKNRTAGAEDWRAPLRDTLLEQEIEIDAKQLLDYTLVAGELYKRLPRRVLAKCVNLEEAAKRLSEVHERTYRAENEIPLYRHLQRLGYFWPDMKTQVSEVQSQCPKFQLVFNKAKSYVIF